MVPLSGIALEVREEGRAIAGSIGPVVKVGGGDVSRPGKVCSMMVSEEDPSW